MLLQFGSSRQPRLSLDVPPMKRDRLNGDVHGSANFLARPALSDQLQSLALPFAETRSGGDTMLEPLQVFSRKTRADIDAA